MSIYGLPDQPHYPAADGWHYADPRDQDGKDCRKLVSLTQGGMRWLGIRAWHVTGRYWMNGGEPERATVEAWRDLPDVPRGFWNSGRFVLLPVAVKCEACGFLSVNGGESRHAPDCALHVKGRE